MQTTIGKYPWIVYKNSYMYWLDLMYLLPAVVIQVIPSSYMEDNPDLYEVGIWNLFKGTFPITC